MQVLLVYGTFPPCNRQLNTHFYNAADHAQDKRHDIRPFYNMVASALLNYHAQDNGHDTRKRDGGVSDFKSWDWAQSYISEKHLIFILLL